MSACARWFSIVVISPVALYVGLFDRDVPFHASGPKIEEGRAGSECEATDEAAAIQKFVSKLRRNASDASGGDDAGVRFILSKDVLKEISKAPKTLPQPLRGVFWLDMRGVYGSSNMPAAIDDLCVSLGGPGATFDPAARTVTIFPSGPSWTWFNSGKAYGEFTAVRSLALGYEFRYSPDYTFAQIVPFVTLPGLGTVRIPTAILSFTTTSLFPEPGQCPPKPGAGKEQVSKCAAARRDSRWFTPYPPFVNRQVYYVFLVGDEDHRPVQPYFDAYLRFAETTSMPDPASFQEQFGVPLPPGARRERVQMVGTRSPPPER